MTAPDPQHPVKHVEQEIRTYRPIRSLFLLDVLGDRASRPIFVWAGAVLLVGTLAYHWLEGWSYLDALYFCVITLATVGYGDLAPTTDVSKLFTVVYLASGLSLLAAYFNEAMKRRERRAAKRSSRRR